MTAMSHVFVSHAPVASEAALAPIFAPLAAPEITIEVERAGDEAARETLLDAAFGPARFAKSSELLRAGRLPAQSLSLVARDGEAVVGTVRLWHVDAGGVPALMLGPLAVADSHRSLGLGAQLMREALWRAAERGHTAIVLIGDEPYYRRFGFEAGLTSRLDWPGEVDRARFLAFEIEPGALRAAKGLVRPTGATFLRAAGPAREARLAA
jgi:predicted N-acetyltransferase YhbS